MSKRKSKKLKLFKNCRKNKAYAIRDDWSWYEGLCFWTDRPEKAKLGTKRQMSILLNNDLYQFKLRGARVVKVRKDH